MGDARNDPVIDVGLLRLLLAARGEPTAVAALAQAGGVDEPAVRAELDRLRRAGCRLDVHPTHGVRLIEAGLATWRDCLEAQGPAERRVAVYQRTASTQQAARQLARAHGRAADAAVGVAEHQTAGRGRLGRAWVTPAGTAVTFSRVRRLEPGDTSAIERLTFASAVAVAEAIEPMLAGRAIVSLKWPNDVCVGTRKLAGILVETVAHDDSIRAAIIGVGVNVSLTPEHVPAELAGRVTSLAMLGARVDRLAVLLAVDAALDAALHRRPLDELLEQWRYRCNMLHQQVTLEAGGRIVQGQVVDLDPHAGLILRSVTGELMHLPSATTSVTAAGAAGRE